ncbi:hypothetical protein JRQ81_009268 [Phrynocephalus forsythii]|uniref:Uncharacterized protein n=1 Tax=Phrynocephalus forsythii TaxID=171643 RepID=A0A9Q0X9F9_9SAUR|nr:hypothetical protein JRQ81_009268 [Phrynocephalus forsythii]
MSFSLFSKSPCPPPCVTPYRRSSVPLGHCGIGGGPGVMGYGGGHSSGVSAASLGILPGVIPSTINQIPPSEVTIQPTPVTVTIPGPIMVASPEPLRVGGYSPCAYGNHGSVGCGLGGQGELLGDPSPSPQKCPVAFQPVDHPAPSHPAHPPLQSVLDHAA